MADATVADRTAIEATLKEFRAATEALDADRAAACFADDAELQTTDGTYVGRPAIAAYIRWTFNAVAEARLQERGFGTQLCGPLAVTEWVETDVTTGGIRFTMPAMAITEFDESGKVKRNSLMLDTWSLVRQSAQQQKGLGGMLVRSVLGRINAELTKGRPQPT